MATAHHHPVRVVPVYSIVFTNGIVGVLASLMGSMYFKRDQQTPKGG